VNNHNLTSGTNVTISGVSGSGFTNGTYVAAVHWSEHVYRAHLLHQHHAESHLRHGQRHADHCHLRFTTVTASGTHLLAAGQSVTNLRHHGGTFSPSINGTFTIHSAPAGTTFVVPVTRVSSSGVNYGASVLSTPAGFTDLVRDRDQSYCPPDRYLTAVHRSEVILP
jgi:hypothetical protein